MANITNYTSYTIVGGTSGNDSIYNGGSHVTVEAAAGKDTVNSSGYRSMILAGAGNDYVSVSNGYTTVEGGSGNDTVNSFDYGNMILAGSGNDYVSVSGSYTTVEGGAGNDKISLSSTAYGNVIEYASGDGKDTVIGFNDDDTLHITKGNYSTVLSGNDVIVKVGSGSVTLKDVGMTPIKIQSASGTVSTVTAFNNIENIDSDVRINGKTTNGGKDSIVSSGDRVTINAGKGNDTVNNYGDYSIINAGDGNDHLFSNSYSYSYSSVNGGSSYHATLNGGAGNDTIYSYGNLELVNGDSGHDYIDSSSDYSTLNGGAGNDTIYNRGDLSVINGGAGNDYLISEFAYASSVTGTSYYSTLSGGAGNDNIQLADSDSKIIIKYASGDGKDVVTGFNADDTLHITKGKYSTVLSGSDVIVKVGKGSVTLKDATWINIKNANGKVSSKRVFNPIENFASDVRVSGKSANNGKDSIYSSGDRVTINAGKGNDTVRNYGDYSIINAGDGNDYVTSSSYYVTVNGGNGNDSLYTYNDLSYINGDSGNDYIYSSSSYSTLNGGKGNDTIRSSGRYVTISGGDGNDSLYSSGRKSSVSGGKGSDTIDVYASYNTIAGGAGNDKISLSSWADRSVVKYASGDGNDVIEGFNSNDTLYITKGTYSAKKNGDDVIVTVGKGKITLQGAANKEISIKDSKGKVATKNYQSSASKKVSSKNSAYSAWFDDEKNIASADNLDSIVKNKSAAVLDKVENSSDFTNLASENSLTSGLNYDKK